MKKLSVIPFLLFAVISLAACGDDKNKTPDTPDPDNNGRYLILYASRTNNTERIAQFIQTTLNCDIQKVEPETAYDSDYNAMLERSQEELDAISQGNYPPVKTSIENFDEYDIIFIGYPIWHGHMATPMQTFLHTHASKLAQKRLVLFATSGSSGISTSVNEARKLCPDATIVEPTLLLTSSTITQMTTRVTAWLEEIGAKREESDSSQETSMKVSISVGNRTITATLEDNAASKDLLSRLPLEITLNDYGNMTEKIFYPNPKLTTEGVTRGCTPTPGDITIYVPWGNVAIFCKNWSYSNDLIKIGHIDGNGIETLNVKGDIQVKIEKI